LLKDYSRAVESSKMCLRPSKMFCLFIEIYWSIVFKCDFEENLQQVLFLQYVFNLTAEKWQTQQIIEETF
jgi:hypothetical protein